MRRVLAFLTPAEHAAALYALRYCAAVGVGGDFTARNIARFEQAERGLTASATAEVGHYPGAIRQLAADVIRDSCSCDGGESHAADCLVRTRRAEINAALSIASLLARKGGA